jgi:tetratricopeptide (TPR) repeat protein
VKLKASIIIILVFFAAEAVFAQNRFTFPRLAPDQKAVNYYLLGQQNNGFTWAELAEISLWASGDTNPANLEKIRATVWALNSSPDLPSTNREKAEYILNYMHKNILKSYSLYQTRIDTLLANGRYNCVSSAVVYTILCKAAGINTSGVMTREHAFVVVHLDNEDIDVETTNQYGFNPGNKKEFHDSAGRLTGFTYVPPSNYRDRQTISQIELVSLILNNKIADSERQSRYNESVPAAIDRAALLAGNALTINNLQETQNTIFIDPRRDLLDRVFNFGASLLKAGREEEALRWAAAASPLYPDAARWQEFILAAVNNNVMKLARASKLQEARTFLEGQKTLLTEADYREIDSILTDAELLRNASLIRTASDGDTVVSAILQARGSGKLNENRANELITFSVLKTAENISNGRLEATSPLETIPPGKNWRGALEYVQNAVNRFGTNRDYERAVAGYRSNIVSDYHNRFAAEWNKRNYDAAERILNEALREFPGDRQLLRDKDIVDRQRTR